jgi:DNA-binding response OmpR family regulator
MTTPDRRMQSDRRRAARGGRRASDLPGRFPKILVADSYDGARIPCVKYLDRLGFSVDQAVTGSEVLERIETARPHVILAENSLRVTPIAHIIDRLSRTSQPLPLIVMMSDLGVSEPLAGLPQVSVLQKPFSLLAMLEEIRRVLREQVELPAPVSELASL